MKPRFEVVDLGKRCYAVNDHGRTVATVSSHGDIDWILRSPMQKGSLITGIRKETHLGYVLGLKLMLVTNSPSTRLREFSYRPEADGSRLVLTGIGESADGAFLSITRATLAASHDTGRYEWGMETDLLCQAADPVSLRWIEFNNVYPAFTGRCMLYAPKKRFNCTLMVDAEGTVWKCPHQHMLHYTQKIRHIEFAPGTLAGFFGEPTGSPVVITKAASLAPDWAICDMYYDLHCGARPVEPIRPGQKLSFSYEIKYLGKDESQALLDKSRPVPITKEDWEVHEYPRLELGLNDFSRTVNIDGFDDASGFRQKPPVLVWDRDTGHSAKGALRITNRTAMQTVWSAEPPSEIPPEKKLHLRAMVKTDGVEGKGAFVRVRYHCFQWDPTPHVDWVKELETPPVSGTSGDWVRVEMPVLHVPRKDFDYLVWIDFVLDGKGVAWLTDVDIELEPAPEPEPELERGSSRHKTASKSRGKVQSGSAAPSA